ncbi:MAG TPA: cysteine synthase A [Campylobacteraceae bacterium]|nr:cysteine synthase A [Campylobacteraceae bacterium]
MHIAGNITELIGNTPLIRLNTPSTESGANIIGKCEFLNPTSSVKDRIGFSMIHEALESGKIDTNSTLIEPTSGNTGIALASICASLGIRLILTMPESMSIERRKILSALGAKLELTPREKGMNGAIEKAKALQESLENAVILGQFSNPANPKIHRETTAIEIYNDTEGSVDIFVAAVGTGGTLTGTGEELKKLIPGLRVVAVEPAKSPVLSGGSPAPHKIQGIGAGFVPPILDTSVYDEIVTVADEDAIQTARNLARTEGLLVGISSGANVWAAMQVARQNPGKRIVTILCDTGERYLSTELFD